MNEIVVMNPTTQDIKNLLTAGKKISGFSGYFDIPKEDVHKNKDKNSGLPIAPGYTAKIRDICTCLQSKDKTKMIVKMKYDKEFEVVDGQNRISLDKLDASSMTMEAMVSAYGQACIKSISDLSFDQYVSYVVPTSEYLDSLTKAAIQAYYETELLSIAGVDWAKTKAVNLALIKAYYGYV